MQKHSQKHLLMAAWILSGTETHLVLVDLRPKGLTGKMAEVSEAAGDLQ